MVKTNGEGLKQGTQLVPFNQALQASGAKLLNVLPVGLDETDKKDMAKAMIYLTIKAYSEVPKLRACSPDSIINSLMDCATLGMIPFSKMNECTILPYGNVASMQLEYRGIIKLCKNTGEYKNIRVGVVREGDKLEYYKGLNQDLRHYESKEPAHNRAVTHVYALYELLNGGSDFEVMTIEDIRKHRDKYSKQYKASVKYKKEEDAIWIKEEVPMSIKTALIKLMKYAPKSDKLINQLALDRDLKREIAPEKKDFTEAKETEFIKQRNADATGVYEDDKTDKEEPEKETKKEPETEQKKKTELKGRKPALKPDEMKDPGTEEKLVDQKGIASFYAKLTELGFDKAKSEKISDWVKKQYKVKSKKELTATQLGKAMKIVIEKVNKNKEAVKIEKEFNEQNS